MPTWSGWGQRSGHVSKVGFVSLARPNWSSGLEGARRSRAIALTPPLAITSWANSYATNVAGRLGLTETNNIDGYLAADDVADVVDRHGLMREDLGRVTLRAAAMDLDLVRHTPPFEAERRARGSRPG